MPVTIGGSGPITGVTSINTSVSDTELGYLDGVTSALQTQIDGKPTGSATSWTSYTPALTASTTNPTLGTGSIAEGQYLKIGKLVIFQGIIRFGTSGTAAGSGTYRFSLPSAASEGLTSQVFQNSGYVYDVSTNATRLVNTAFSNGLSYVVLYYLETTGQYSTNVTATAPWSWTASDEITINGWYLEA